jgi:hypothetical protein
MKHTVALSLALSIAILGTGCTLDTDKIIPEGFKVSAGHSTNSYTQRHNKVAVNVNRDGVTFSDGSYITPQGDGAIVLPRGYYYISSDGGRILAADNRGNIIVFKSNGEKIASTKLDAPLVSGVAYSHGIAYLLQGNRFGLYDPFKNKVTYQKEFAGGNTVDTRLANPIITQNFIALPTLDGKLILINMHTPSAPGVIPIGQNKKYSNLIFAKAVGNTIIAATPNRVLSISPGQKKELNVEVADILVKNGNIYLLTRDGKVEILTLNLEKIASRQFQYADFATVAVLNGKVYAFAKSGSLVVLDSSLKKYKLYSVGSARNYSFVSGRYLYIDKKRVDLSALNYE